MYPISTNIIQDSASLYSGNSNKTNGSFNCHNAQLKHSRMIPRSNSTSDLFEVPGSKGGNSKKRKLPYVLSPDFSRSTSSFSGSKGSLVSRDGNPSHAGNGAGGNLNMPIPSGQHARPHYQRAHSVTSVGSRNISSQLQSDLQAKYARQARSHSQFLSQPVSQFQTQHTRAKSSLRVQTALGNDHSFGLASNKRLNPILEGSYSRRPLTPYQMQRKQMKKSFQFPNGENFTPRSKLGSDLPKSYSTTSMNVQTSSHPSSTGAVRGSSQRLDPLSRSQSMNSVTVSCNMPPALIRMNTSPAASGSSRSSYNSMKERTSNASTNSSTEPSTEPSSNSSSTALRISQQQCSKVIPDLCPPQAESSLKIDEKLKERKMPNNPINFKNTASLPTSSKSKPKSKSKIRSFFKKLFSSTSRKKDISVNNEDSCRKQEKNSEKLKCVSNTLSTVEGSKIPKENIEIPGEIPSNAISDCKQAECRIKEQDENLLFGEEEDEEYDDILMDTDLVFDSLLLKADEKRTSAVLVQLHSNTRPEEISRECDQQQNNNGKPGNQIVNEDLQIDSTLISDFSRLGAIIDCPEHTSVTTVAETKILNLPKRSSRRPMLSNKEMIRSFYQPAKSSDSFADRLIKTLRHDWADVYVNVPINSMVNQDDLSSGGKRLRFSTGVYLCDTWSPSEYRRSDRRFIKNRRRMMQLENEGFVQAIKVELNEYKRNEMIVHQDSVKYTHLFS